MSTILSCPKKCCTIVWDEPNMDVFEMYSRRGWEHPQPVFRSGVLLVDTSASSRNPRILLVQSYGNLWGVPKGRRSVDESNVSCAVRELHEETGISIPTQYCTVNNSIRIDRSVYFVVQHPHVSVRINSDNDVNSAGWIKLSCVMEMARSKQIRLNCHGKKLMTKVFGVRLKSMR